ncbi:MAG: hypothetical protein OHK0029_31800 [Armatimonadaceae bacterium]
MVGSPRVKGGSCVVSRTGIMADIFRFSVALPVSRVYQADTQFETQSDTDRAPVGWRYLRYNEAR